jgi:transposase-like protein
MGKQRRKYSREMKTELVEKVLAGRSTLEVARDEGINPHLITRWKKQYMEGKFHGTSATDSELRKLKAKNCELEQMVGKLTMEVYTWDYETYADVVSRLPYFIEEVYNKKRLHPSLGYMPQEEFENYLMNDIKNSCKIYAKLR